MNNHIATFERENLNRTIAIAMPRLSNKKPSLKNECVSFDKLGTFQMLFLIWYYFVYENVLDIADHVLLVPSTNARGFSYQYNGRVGQLSQKTVLPLRLDIAAGNSDLGLF